MKTVTLLKSMVLVLVVFVLISFAPPRKKAIDDGALSPAATSTFYINNNFTGSTAINSMDVTIGSTVYHYTSTTNPTVFPVAAGTIKTLSGVTTGSTYPSTVTVKLFISASILGSLKGNTSVPDGPATATNCSYLGLSRAYVQVNLNYPSASYTNTNLITYTGNFCN